MTTDHQGRVKSQTNHQRLRQANQVLPLTGRMQTLHTVSYTVRFGYIRTQYKEDTFFERAGPKVPNLFLKKYSFSLS